MKQNSNTTSFTWDSNVLYSIGNKTKYEYDPNGNMTVATDPKGGITRYTYDALNRVESAVDALGDKTKYEYDCMGKIVAITDAMGNVTAYIDEKGNKTTYLYSLSGNLLGVIDALGNESQYTYDECDQLIEVKQVKETNEKNNSLPVTKYERDLLGNVTKITDALGNSESFAYDKKSQLIEKIDKEGYLTTYGYQANGEVEKIKYADGKEVRLSYNALRQLEEVEDWLGITRIQSNPRGQATKVSYPDGAEVSYTYGKLGEKTQMVYPDGKEVNYAYDEFNRLAKVTDEVGTTTYSYNEQGYLSEKSYPNDIETQYTYTNKGRLANLIHKDSKGIIDAYQYSYDIQGNKTTIEKQRRGLPEDSGKFGYAYDELQRLTNVSKDGNTLRTYGYDAFGNRASSTETGKEQSLYTYNVMNQLVSKVDSAMDGGISKEERYAYDKRGNLVESYQNNNLINQYHFGALNRLEKAVNHQTKEASEYMYNGLGHRVGKTIGEPVEVMLPTVKLDTLTINPTKKIEDTIDLTKQYHNLLQRTEGDNITSFTWDSNVLRATGKDSSDNNNYNQYLQDDLGSPIRFFSPNGNMEEIYSYDEFGQETVESQNSGVIGCMQPFTYTGYQKDNVTNTYYAQAREYAPEVGRFASEDVIKGSVVCPLTMNHYVYCLNIPLVCVDRNGLSPEDAADGREAHTMLQIMLVGAYGPEKVTVERPIIGSSLAGGTGFADVVYTDNGVAEVYEIKPGSYADPRSDNNLEGKNQLNRYIQGLKREGAFKSVEPGQKLNFLVHLTTLPSIRHSDRLIKYYTYPEDPGMIYWEHVKKSQVENVPAMEEEPGIDWAIVGMYTLGGVFVIGGVVYFIFSHGDTSLLQKGVACFS